jgi:hypothetical protein
MRAYSNHFWTIWIYVYPLFFVTIWCVVCFLISAFSGWQALARRFRMQVEPYGDVKGAGPFFYAVQMRNKANYSSVIRVAVASDALYLSILFLFRVGHPPLAIPWGEIKFSKITVFWRRYLVLTLGKAEQIPLRISERMAERLGIMERSPN